MLVSVPTSVKLDAICAAALDLAHAAACEVGGDSVGGHLGVRADAEYRHAQAVALGTALDAVGSARGAAQNISADFDVAPRLRTPEAGAHIERKMDEPVWGGLSRPRTRFPAGPAG